MRYAVPIHWQSENPYDENLAVIEVTDTLCLLVEKMLLALQAARAALGRKDVYLSVSDCWPDVYECRHGAWVDNNGSRWDLDSGECPSAVELLAACGDEMSFGYCMLDVSQYGAMWSFAPRHGRTTGETQRLPLEVFGLSADLLGEWK